MCLANAVVNINEEVCGSGDPDVIVRGFSISVSVKAISKKLLDLLKGMESDCTLRSVGEIIRKEGVGDGDGVGHIKVLVFGNGNWELAKEDGDRGFRGERDIVVHVCERGLGGDKEGGKR